MWQVHRASARLTALAFVVIAGSAARADEVVYLDRGANGFNLPGVTLPQGQDEVHAADGTTCRSAVSGSGSYIDVGAINGDARSGHGNVATYARVVIPIGVRGKRIDCTRLYELEIERLKMELDLLKMGIAPGGGAVDRAASRNGAANGDSASEDWVEDGWSDRGVAGDAAPPQEPVKRARRQASRAR